MTAADFTVDPRRWRRRGLSPFSFASDFGSSSDQITLGSRVVYGVRIFCVLCSLMQGTPY